jgi:hypothetical protein
VVVVAGERAATAGGRGRGVAAAETRCARRRVAGVDSVDERT